MNDLSSYDNSHSRLNYESATLAKRAAAEVTVACGSQKYVAGMVTYKMFCSGHKRSYLDDHRRTIIWNLINLNVKGEDDVQTPSQLKGHTLHSTN